MAFFKAVLFIMGVCLAVAVQCTASECPLSVLDKL